MESKVVHYTANMLPDPMDNITIRLKEALREQGYREGLDAIGFAPPLPPPHHEALLPWLAEGRQAGMAWLALAPQRRQDPRCQMAGLGTILTLGLNCRPPGPPLDYLDDPGRLGLAGYARHGDYHEILKTKARHLLAWLEATTGQTLAHRLFVDGGPVMEKPLAVAAGLGWQGKHGLLVNRRHGCWLLLAEIFLPLSLPPDSPSRDHCGRCDRCQTACPTGALADPYRLDANRCLAYHTVENRGAIPRALRAAMGNRVFGCDDCLAACPWNRFSPACREPALLPRADLTAPMLLTFVQLSPEEFAHRFKGHPLARTGVVRFLRNVAVALGNWRHTRAIPALEHLLGHAAPLVRQHAVWGLGQLRRTGLPQAEEPLHRHRPWETDPSVQAELDWALGDY